MTVSWNLESTSRTKQLIVNGRRRLRVLSTLLSTDVTNYSRLRVVSTIFKDIIVTTNIIVYEHYCYCCMFLLVKTLCMDMNITV